MEKYLSIQLLAIACLAVFFGGCITEHEKNIEPDKNNTFSFEITLPESEMKTRTVPAEEGENKIHDMTLFFFTHSTNGTGTYVNYYRVPDEMLPQEHTERFNLEIKFESSMGISVSDAYSILVFANMQGNYFTDIDTELDGFVSMISPMKELDAWNYFTMTVSGVGTTVPDQTNNINAMPMDNLPMSASVLKEREQNLVECKLLRSVVRFDIVNKAAGFKLVSASIWNAFPQTTIWERGITDYNQPRLKRYYGVRDETNGYEEIKGGLYAFENVSTQPEQNDEKTTCLILGLKRDNGGDNIEYFRVNVSPQVTGQYLQRNNVYQTTITKVNSPGASTELDAYNGARLLLDVTINGWDRDEDGLVLKNGEYMMVIPTTRAVFGPEAEDRQYYVHTSGEADLEMSIIEMPAGMEAWLVDNDLFMRVSDYSLEHRKGVIELRFAGMKGTIEMVQSGLLEKYLKLSRVILPDWPAGTYGDDMVAGDPIVVNSSGSWTAEIYNGNFSFSSGTDQYIITGNDGDGINNIYTTSINDGVADRTSFVLVSLDDDPDNYRNVIVLKQTGRGGFTLTPNYTNIYFEPDGSLASLPENTDTFTVTPGETTDNWKAEIINDPKSAFSIEYGAGNNIAGDLCTGAGTFTVKCNDNNYNENASGTVRITHNGSNTKTIQVTQNSYSVTLTPPSVSAIPAGGGTSEIITVTSNLPNAIWSATVTSTFTNLAGETASFVVNNEKQSSLSSQQIGGNFRVYMPGIDRYLAVNPSATVRVTIDGTPLAAEITIGQSNIVYKPIVAHTVVPGYPGGWSPNTTPANFAAFGQWANEMINGANFGPSGVVYAKEQVDLNSSGWYYANVHSSPKLDNIRIFNMNGVLGVCEVDFMVWKNDLTAVFVISTWEGPSSHVAFNKLGLNGVYSFGVEPPAGTAYNIARKINNVPAVNGTELWDYIFNNGPFGSVDPNNVTLYSQHFSDYRTSLTNYPDTFIPLIMSNLYPERPMFGIDPVNRIIWLGHKDLFGTDSKVAYRNWDNPDNVKFLRNVIAWMISVNNYGDAFNDRFKNDRSK